MEPYTAPPGLWRLGAGPFIFRGEPPFCIGEVELINDSTEKLKVRSLGALGEASGRMLGQVRLAARLGPGDRGRVSAQVVVDPHAPPGTYSAELALGSQRERVVVHIFEKRAVVLSPRRIALRGASGDSLSHPLIIANRGNVTHVVPKVALVHLEERDWLGRSLVYALRELGAEEGHGNLLDRTVREMRATDVPPMRVTVHASAEEVPPGRTIEAELELTVPNQLIKGRTYVRTIPFMSSSLAFELECNGSIHSSKRRSQ